MALRRTENEVLEAALAIVLLARDREDVARALRALLPGLDADVALVAGGTEAGRRALEELSGTREVVWLEADGAAAWNAAAELAPHADLVLLDGATEVGRSWLTELRAVAVAEPDAATITPVSNHAGFLSVPRRNLPWPLPPLDLTPARAAELAGAASLRLHPRTPTALAHCALVTRTALALTGPFDGELDEREALADFCARATALGLAHVVADEVLVAHRGAAGPSPVREWPGEAAQRHPALAAAVAEAADGRHSRLARALLAVSVGLEPLQVTIDARSLGGTGITGTTVHVVEVLGALTARDDVRVRALLPEAVGPAAAAALGRMEGLERLSVSEAESGTAGRTHVVHRPWQVEGVQDMAFLDGLGERTVVTNQDLIGYRTPSVFGSVRAWEDYRRATADALGLAAMVVFFSEAAAADALADDLVPAERARVVALGARPDHLVADPGSEGDGPRPLADGARPFLLMLGNRFRHKNTRFALELLAALRADHGWDGDLVLAGAEVLHGSSSGDDAAWRLQHPEVDGHVVELGTVGDAEKAWLLAHAAAVVYPSTYEGFGLIPFEAAEAGTPALVAWVSALRDTVPEELALLEPWDAARSARRVAPVLVEGEARRALVEGIRAAGAELTWSATGDGLVAAYRAALALPAPTAARLTHDLARAEHDYWTVRDGIPDEVWALVRPDAPQINQPLARDLAAMLADDGGRKRLLRAMKLARRLPGR